MNRMVRKWVGGWVCALMGLGLSGAPASAGKLEDALLQNKQITIDQWVQIKAEEEKRQSKASEESRGVGDAPVRERWYEKISLRGYTQFRFNNTLNRDQLLSAQGDRSIGRNNEFFLRRGRIILSGQPHERVFVYIQPEFGSLLSGTEQTVTLRDWYADLFLTEDKEWRIRAGLSKVPFGFENMQSSQNRLALDRNDAINSAQNNERDLGLFLYYAPTSVRERFRRLVDSGLKGSGDYGMLGIGVYGGQTANKRDANKNKHVVFHSSYPFELPFINRQMIEIGMDAYTGQFNVGTTPIIPLTPTFSGTGAALSSSPQLRNGGNYLDERVAWHLIAYPQPIGFQAEFTVGRGPELNTARTEVVVGTVSGGYAQLFYNYQCDTYCLRMIPFVRYQEYFGGKKHEANAPRNSVRELEIGLEYQINQAVELTVMGTFTSRTSADPEFAPTTCTNSLAIGAACLQTPYQKNSGNLIRFQLQWSF